MVLLSLPDFADTRGLFLPSTRTRGGLFSFFYWNKWKLCYSAGFFPPRQTRQFNFGKLATNSKKVWKNLASPKLLQTPTGKRYTEQVTIRSSLTLRGHFMKVPGVVFTEWLINIIEGNLSAAVLALGRLCELGWQCSCLESNRGDLHKVFLKPWSGMLLK